MEFDLCHKNRAKEPLLNENPAIWPFGHLFEESSESIRSSVSLDGQIYVMVNTFG